MKIEMQTLHRVMQTALLILTLLAITGSSARAQSEEPKRRIIPISINKGENYTITDIKQPEATKVVSNPNALVVQTAPGRIELIGDTSRRMIRTKAESHHGKHHQRTDLYDVDCDVHRRRTVYAAAGDPGYREREYDRDHRHKYRTGIGGTHEAGPNRADQVADQDSHYRDHHSGINPVVKVRAPSDDELR